MQTSDTIMPKASNEPLPTEVLDHIARYLDSDPCSWMLASKAMLRVLACSHERPIQSALQALRCAGDILEPKIFCEEIRYWAIKLIDQGDAYRASKFLSLLSNVSVDTAVPTDIFDLLVRKIHERIGAELDRQDTDAASDLLVLLPRLPYSRSIDRSLSRGSMDVIRGQILHALQNNEFDRADKLLKLLYILPSKASTAEEFVHDISIGLRDAICYHIDRPECTSAAILLDHLSSITKTNTATDIHLPILDKIRDEATLLVSQDNSAICEPVLAFLTGLLPQIRIPPHYFDQLLISAKTRVERGLRNNMWPIPVNVLHGLSYLPYSPEILMEFLTTTVHKWQDFIIRKGDRQLWNVSHYFQPLNKLPPGINICLEKSLRIARRKRDDILGCISNERWADAVRMMKQQKMLLLGAPLPTGFFISIAKPCLKHVNSIVGRNSVSDLEEASTIVKALQHLPKNTEIPPELIDRPIRAILQRFKKDSIDLHNDKWPELAGILHDLLHFPCDNVEWEDVPFAEKAIMDQIMAALDSKETKMLTNGVRILRCLPAKIQRSSGTLCRLTQLLLDEINEDIKTGFVQLSYYLRILDDLKHLNSNASIASRINFVQCMLWSRSGNLWRWGPSDELSHYIVDFAKTHQPHCNMFKNYMGHG